MHRLHYIQHIGTLFKYILGSKYGSGVVPTMTASIHRKSIGSLYLRRCSIFCVHISPPFFLGTYDSLTSLLKAHNRARACNIFSPLIYWRIGSDVYVCSIYLFKFTSLYYNEYSTMGILSYIANIIHM